MTANLINIIYNLFDLEQHRASIKTESKRKILFDSCITVTRQYPALVLSDNTPSNQYRLSHP